METDGLNERIEELTEELGKREFEDPMCDKLVERISILGKVVEAADRRDSERLASYRQNDINEDKLKLEDARIKADIANSRRDLLGKIISTVGTLVGSFGLAYLSFKGEWLENLLKDRTLWDLAKALKPRH